MRKAVAILALFFAFHARAQNPKFADALRAAQTGDPRSQFIAGMMLMSGQGTKQNLSEAVHWLDAGARAGIAPAMTNLATLYDVGQGVPLDPQRATQLRQQAAAAGEPTALAQLADDRRIPGQAEFRRASTLTDLQKPELAVPYAKRAAAAGSANAGLLLGRAYHFGIGDAIDLPEAVRWYRQSAERGLEDGQRHLAYMYEFGLGVGVDRKMALLYYDKAAAQGSALAKHAAANLRSPEYDQPPPAFFGGPGGKQCIYGYHFQPYGGCIPYDTSFGNLPYFPL